MNSKNEVNKLVWRLVTHVKDTINQNLSKAVDRGDLKIEKDKLSNLLVLIQASADEAASRALTEFNKQVEPLLVKDEVPPHQKI